MTTEVGTCEAKARLPELLSQVQQGHRFTITRRGVPVAQLIPVEQNARSNAAAAIDAFLAQKAKQSIRRHVNINALIRNGRA
jgi:prevent-host-death family protein